MKKTRGAIQTIQEKRMSFVFPPVFYFLLLGLKDRYQKDMTYIIIEAVNEYVMRKEGLVVDNNGKVIIDENNGKGMH